MVELGLKLTLAYLIGSVIGSLVVGYFRGGIDIRTVGSGNAGGTNALRTQGKAFAFWVMVIDSGKGIRAAVGIPALEVHGVAELGVAAQPVEAVAFEGIDPAAG